VVTSRVLANRYQLLERVGSGGMAAVWRAHDEELGRIVAIKVLLEHLAEDPTAAERFRQEARNTAALSHPNIVILHDWGIDGETAFLLI
jgi:serine/threonine-protein kinase